MTIKIISYISSCSVILQLFFSIYMSKDYFSVRSTFAAHFICNQKVELGSGCLLFIIIIVIHNKGFVVKI